jgi:multiple sugar transport system permease protein
MQNEKPSVASSLTHVSNKTIAPAMKAKRNPRVGAGDLFSGGRFVLMLLIPSFLIVLIATGFPLIYSLYVSFTPYELLKPNSLTFSTATMFNNYQALLQDKVFWSALLNTVIFLTVTVNLEYFIALGLSQLIARVTRGQSLIRTVLMIPMMFAPVLVGFQFRWFFNENLGLVNNFLALFGIQGRAWLIDEPFGLIAIMIAAIWMNLPVTTIILLAGTLSLPQELYEAADVDGANAWQKFRRITVPLLAPFTYIALTLRSLDVSRAYDIVRIMTDGGPGQRTELIWTYAGRLAINSGRFGMASAISWITVILSIGFTVYLFRQLVKTRVLQ